MKHKSLSLVLVLLFVSSHSPLALAQEASSNSWTVVQQLKTNEKLVVRKKDGKELKGEMIEASDTALTIDRDGKPLSIPRSDVRQVYVVENKAAERKMGRDRSGDRRRCGDRNRRGEVFIKRRR